MSPHRIELRQARNKQFYLVIKATNGRIILTSETYSSSAHAVRAGKSIMSAGYFVWVSGGKVVLQGRKLLRR